MVSRTIRYPHSCGGEPRGCTQAMQLFYVIPTHVGVNRTSATKKDFCPSYPHSCGGEPPNSEAMKKKAQRYPHSCGGEPSKPINPAMDVRVIPTHVGVNRGFAKLTQKPASYPHSCGGEPSESYQNQNHIKLSPLMWG